MVEATQDIPDANLIDQARRTLVEVYQELASSEALTRALVSERDGHRDVATLWVEVYRQICRDDAEPSSSVIVRL